ncbi:MAG TPA: AAA family ATPase, partial [Gammaproteobacteria bacterium]|nr:AAA family ATPase [Gammaproteobacteria bacterium]
IDVEGGWKFIPESPYIASLYVGNYLRVRHWDPMREAIPRYDGTWEICVVTVQTWEMLQKTYEMVSQYAHDFQTIVIDSVSELQRRLRDNINNTRNTDEMRHQDWGAMLIRMDKALRGLRDQILCSTCPVRVAVFIAETKLMDGKWRPSMQGQITNTLPYWFDIVGYYQPIPILDQNGQYSQTEFIRRLWVVPRPEFIAGERVQGRLGAYIDSPNLTQMLYQVYPSLTAGSN